jgi:hypothetical protein
MDCRVWHRPLELVPIKFIKEVAPVHIIDCAGYRRVLRVTSRETSPSFAILVCKQRSITQAW